MSRHPARSAGRARITAPTRSAGRRPSIAPAVRGLQIGCWASGGGNGHLAADQAGARRAVQEAATRLDAAMSELDGLSVSNGSNTLSFLEIGACQTDAALRSKRTLTVR